MDGRPQEGIRASVTRARALIGEGHLDEADALLADLLRGNASAAERATVLMALAGLAERRADREGAHAHGSRALAMARLSGEPGVAARAASQLACFVLRLGDVESALDLAVDALQVRGRPNVDPEDEAAALSNCGLMFTELGAPQVGLELYETALAHGTRRGLRPALLHPLRTAVLTGGVLVARGMTEAEREPFVDRLLRLGEEVRSSAEDAEERTGATVRLAWLLATVGRYDEALRLLDDAEPGGSQVAGRLNQALTGMVRGAAARHRGDHAGAVAAYDAALPLLEAHGLGNAVVTVLLGRGESLRSLGRWDEAFADLHQALQRTSRHGNGHIERLARQVLQRSDAERARHRLEEAADGLRRENEEDPLTGLGNRRRFEHLELLRHRAPCAVLLADLDHFKRVNDTYGHEVGDAVLRRAAERMGGALRGGDELIRWGGEEFVVLVFDADRRAAAAVAERVRRAVSAGRWDDLLPDAPPTLSVGAACGRLGDERLLARADAALYAAKAGGRDRVVVAGDGR